VRGATVRAETEVKCVTLGRENLTSILGDKVQIIVFNNLMRWSFEKSETMKLLTNIQLEKMAQNAMITNAKEGEIIYRKN
jgi:cGMP-dependent protein kinase 1